MGRVRLLAPLQIRDFRFLWTGASISLVGDGIFLVALAWQVYTLWGAPTALAVVCVAMSLPQALLLLFGGVVSDRFERRRVLIAADFLRGLAIGAMGLLTVTHVLALWQLLLLAAVYGTGTAFFLPAFDATVPDLVPPELLAEANALDQFVRPTALRLVGPALGGVIIAYASAGGAFLIDAGTFAASAIAVLCMRARPCEPTAGYGVAEGLQELKEGYRYVRSQVWLWGTFLSASLAYLLFTGPADVLLPFLVKNTLHGSPQLLGAVFAVGGLGAVASALIMGQAGTPRRHITFMYVTWTIATIAVAGYGLAVLPWQLMLASLAFNAFDTAGLIVWGTTRHRLVPPAMRGRVASFRSVSYGLWPLSYALTAPMVALLGVRLTLVVAGVGGGLVTIAFLFLPGMRDIERSGLLRRSAAGSDLDRPELLAPKTAPELQPALVACAPPVELPDRLKQLFAPRADETLEEIDAGIEAAKAAALAALAKRAAAGQDDPVAALHGMPSAIAV
jgi:MFS family permease